MQRIDDDIKATVKKIIQGNEKRKRRMLNGNASAFDRMAYSVINEALATTKNTRQYIHQCVISMMQTEIYYRRKKIINQTTPPGYRI